MASLKEKSVNKTLATLIWISYILASIGLLMPYIIFLLSKYWASVDIKKGQSLLQYIERLGPVGDLISGTTVPLLTFAGFIMLIVGSAMQKQQLDFSRKELTETQQIIKEQSKTMVLERFENTFFHLLSLHSDIVKGLSLHTREFSSKGFGRIIEQKFFGRECFNKYKHILLTSLSNNNSQHFSNSIDGLHQLYLYTIKKYNNFFNEYSQDLGHYFRSLYRFIKFIDEYKELTEKEKSDYVDLIRAQLSKDEQILLTYNCLSNNGQPFLDFLKKYDLLDGVLETSTFHDDLIIDLYKNIGKVLEREELLSDLVIRA